MPRHPVHFDLASVPQPAAVEAAARRRLRSLESCYPSVQEWDIQLSPVHDDAHSEHYQAITLARIVGGDTLRCSAEGDDPLSAARLAFNALESKLVAEHEGARHRAAEWLSTVRRRLGHRPDMI